MRSTLLITAATCRDTRRLQPGADDEASGRQRRRTNQVLPITDAAVDAARRRRRRCRPRRWPGTAPPRFMHERHEKYEAIGKAMKAASRELKGGSPDLAAVRKHAGDHRRLRAANPEPVPARHRPRRRQDRRQGRDLAEARRISSAKSQAFTGRGDGLRRRRARHATWPPSSAAHGDLGKTCKACHDLYRAEH